MSEKTDGGTAKDSHYARLRRAHRERAGGGDRRARGRASVEGAAPPEGLVRLYGLHTVAAALRNPRRRAHRLLVTRNALQRLGISEAEIRCPYDIVEPKAIDRMLGSDAVHQGVMLEAEPLAARQLRDLQDCDLVLVLDQVTDPHNVGAILRSAAAFDVGALVTTARHSPQESGVLAKAASGALEIVPHIETGNLSEAIGTLGEIGFRTIGLDSQAEEKLEDTLAGDRIALVLGSEGKGLRQKTRGTVDVLARLDVPGEISSLNVSNACAVSLYAARRTLPSKRD